MITTEREIIYPGDEHPGLSLWEFLDNDMNYNSKFLQHIKETSGINPINTDDPANNEVKTRVNLGPLEDKFIKWMMANKESVRKTIYKDAYHKSHLHSDMNTLPLEVGYNDKNTTDYSWGIYKHNDELKELVGGREAFKKMNIDYDHALCRLLVYMPGQFCPWHYDCHASWAESYPELNPKIVREAEFVEKIKAGESRYDMADQHVCDLGKIVRRLVTVSEWDCGHLLEMENSFFPNWASGDVFDVPACIWYGSANAGIKLKITLVITSIETEE